MGKEMNGATYKCPKCKKTERTKNGVKCYCYTCKKRMKRVS